MQAIEFLIATFYGTTVMTVFTYMASAIFGKQYRQPVLIEYFQIIFRLQLSRNAKRFVGWLLHYATGAAFLLLFQLYWQFDDKAVTWTSGWLLGILSGLAGALVWKICFMVFKDKITADRGFYIHIFLAHIVFTLGVVSAYKLMWVVNNMIGA